MGFDPVVDINIKTLAIDEDKLEENFMHDDISNILNHAQGINGLTEKIYNLCKKIKFTNRRCMRIARVNLSSKKKQDNRYILFSFTTLII